METKGKPTRKSPRAEWYDYAGGTYFVTSVTKDRSNYFGYIENGKIELSKLGIHLNREIDNLTSHYHYVKVINHVVMPNHFHLIIYIENNDLPKRLRELGKDNFSNRYEKANKLQGWLSVIIGGLKANITRFAHKEKYPFAWQSSFHDHIIRGTEDFNKISEYIDNNIINWEVDRFHQPIKLETRSISSKVR